MPEKIEWPVWPAYTDDHEQAVLRVIRSNQLYAAHEVKAFEADFKSFVDSPFTVGVGNATQGLHLALAALGVGVGDEVIVTPYSWISSASCVLMQNAIPVFVDIEPESFGICPQALEQAITSHTKAVILVHMFGLASKVEQIQQICQDRGIALIEDASHAHGARLDGKHLGTFGKIGVFSLHQRKAISVGDGGIMCTDDENLYQKIWGLRSFGNPQLSYNYRMTEFAAALGRVGLAGLDDDNEKRRINHKILADEIRSNSVQVVEPMDGVEAVYYANLLDIDMSSTKQQKLCQLANEAGIPIKRTWQPLHKHPHFQKANMPNHIAPWNLVDRLYDEPSTLILPNSEKFQEHRLYELDCHPLVPQEFVHFAGQYINSLVDVVNAD